VIVRVQSCEAGSICRRAVRARVDLRRDGAPGDAGALNSALAARGAEGILLGCTEIDLLVGPQDAPVPVFDTTRLHAHRAVDIALGSEPA
jgi:aspartate racemase